MKDIRHTHQNEARFWDQVALEAEESLVMTPEALVVNDSFYGRAFEYLGDLTGKRVLDCACGTGHWTVLMAMKGATVVGFDISPECVRTTQERARLNGVEDRVQAIVAPFEGLPLEPESFDLAFGSFALHHVDISAAGPALQQLLKPGARAVFVETTARNPFLMLAREHFTYRLGLARVGSEDEHPLTLNDIKTFGANFKTWRREYPGVFLFQLISRILYHTLIARLIAKPGFFDKLGQFLWTITSTINRSLDTLLHRIPFLRRLSYWVLVEVEK